MSSRRSLSPNNQKIPDPEHVPIDKSPEISTQTKDIDHAVHHEGLTFADCSVQTQLQLSLTAADQPGFESRVCWDRAFLITKFADLEWRPTLVIGGFSFAEITLA